MSEKVLRDQSILIGIILPLSGLFKYFGENGLYGCQMAANEINEAGGILGAKIELITRDFRGEPREAGEIAESLISIDKVHFIRGTFLSPAAIHVINVTERHQTPFLTIGCSADEITERGYKYVFRMSTNSLIFNKLAIDFLESVVIPSLKRAGSLKIATIYENQLMGHSFIKGGFLRSVSSQHPDWDIISINAYNYKTPDFSSIIEDINTQDPDVLVISTYLRDGVSLIRNLYKTGFKPKVILGIGAMQTLAFIEMLGDRAKDIFICNEFWPDRQHPNPKALREIAIKFWDEYKRPFDFLAYSGYAGIYIIKYVIEKCKCLDVSTIRETLLSEKFYFPWYGELFFYENGQMNIIPTIVQVQRAKPDEPWQSHGLTLHTVYPSPYVSSMPILEKK